MPRQRVKTGDVFWVPLDDGTVVLGQVLEIQKDALDSITCAFFDVRRAEPGEHIKDLISPICIQFVTKDLFTNGTWKRVDNAPVSVPISLLPYRETEKNGWVGARIIGSGIIRMFLSAFYGLRSWDEMHDPNYYENLLLPGVQRQTDA